MKHHKNIVIPMRSKKELEKELSSIKEQLDTLKSAKVLEKEEMEKHQSPDDSSTSAQMFSLLKYMIDENKRTTMILHTMLQKIDRLETEIDDPVMEESEEEPQEPKTADKAPKQLAISTIDAKIMQFIQLSEHSMACADDIRRGMNYRGRNAACARLNKLYKMGLIERFQLGHKVYYKYDAGKATNLLIISPPQ